MRVCCCGQHSYACLPPSSEDLGLTLHGFFGFSTFQIHACEEANAQISAVTRIGVQVGVEKRSEFSDSNQNES